MSVRARLGRFLMVLTLIVAIGGHWALLQSVAWVGMLANNVRQCSLTDAITKTFDGKHPCALCKVVADGKKAEQKKTLVKVETKFDFWLAPVSPLLVGPTPVGFPRACAELLRTRLDPPPTPPPRLAAV